MDTTLAAAALIDLRGLGVGERSALATAGVLRPVLGPCWVAASREVDADVRWAVLDALGPELLPRGAVVGLAAAAWLWLGGRGPTALACWVPRTHRAPAPGVMPVLARDGVPPPEHVVRSAGVAVTDPLRTVVDLLALPEPPLRRLDRCRALLRVRGPVAPSAPPDSALVGLSPRRVRTVRERWERLR